MLVRVPKKNPTRVLFVKLKGEIRCSSIFLSPADFYLNMNRTDESELYHKAHENVAVMFASLTELSIDESNILIDLNEIICEFDKLLFEPSFVCRIEKIKIAGTTYMAACGLEAHRRDSMRNEESDTDQVVKVMAEFAAEMIAVLDRLNVESFPNTKPYKYVSHVGTLRLRSAIIF